MSKSSFPLPPAWLERLEDLIRSAPTSPRDVNEEELSLLAKCLELVQHGQFALKYKLYQRLIVSEKLEEAYSIGLALLGNLSLTLDQRRLLHLQQASVAAKRGVEGETLKNFLALFSAIPTYDFAYRIADLAKHRESGSSPFEVAHKLCFEQFSRELPVRSNNVIEPRSLESMLLARAPRSEVTIPKISHLGDRSHLILQPYGHSTELSAINYYQVPGAMVRKNALSYEIYDRESRFIPEVSSGDAPLSTRPPARYHRLDGVSALVACCETAGYGGEWFIDELTYVVSVLKYSAEPVKHWVFGRKPSRLKTESLKRLGILPENIVALDEHPFIESESLICISGLASEIRGPFRSGWHESVSMIRNVFLGRYHLFPPKPTRRIMIAPAEQRMEEIVYGWEGLFSRLEKDFGFERVVLSGLSLDERIELFSHTEFVVAFHGAGLQNIVIANPKMSVLEIFHPQNGTSINAMIAALCGINYRYLCGENDVVFNHDCPSEEVSFETFQPIIRLTPSDHEKIYRHLEDQLARAYRPAVKSAATSVITEVPRVKNNGDHVALYDNITVQQKPNALSFLSSFINQQKIETVVEIGTGYGGLSKSILDNTSCQVFTIDIEDRSPRLDSYSDKLTKIVGDCFSEIAIKAIERFGVGTRRLFLIDGGDKPKEFNYYKSLLAPGDYIMVHDFAPTARDFEELKRNNVWLWHESSEDKLNLVGLERLENFETIWKAFVWGAYRCVEVIDSRITATQQPAAPMVAVKRERLASAVSGIMGRLGSVDPRLSDADMKYLFSIGKSLADGGRCLEVGSSLGHTAIAIAAGMVDSSNATGQVFCIDTWKDTEGERQVVEMRDGAFYATFLDNIEKAGVGRFIAPMRMSSPKAASLFSDKYFDVVFINGQSSYEGYVENLNLWYSKCKIGGLFIVRGIREDNRMLEEAIRMFSKDPRHVVELFREGSDAIWVVKSRQASQELRSLI